ncbi:hypothetical protein AusDCA_1004 [Desulfitobacterium sp. AusDCA]
MKYAIFFNRKYHFVGQLMQGRFQAEIIEGIFSVPKQTHDGMGEQTACCGGCRAKWSPAHS